MRKLVVVGLAAVLGRRACAAWLAPSWAGQHDECPADRRYLTPAILTLNEALPEIDIVESAAARQISLG